MEQINVPLWTSMGHEGWRKDGKTFIRWSTIVLKFWDEFNANFVLLYFSSYSSIKMQHLYLKDVEKNNKAVHLRLVQTYFSKIFSILRNTLPWHSKKIVHLLFVYSRLSWIKHSTFFVDYHNGSEMYKWYQVLVHDLDLNVDESLAWLTQKLKIQKCKCHWTEL